MLWLFLFFFQSMTLDKFGTANPLTDLSVGSRLNVSSKLASVSSNHTKQNKTKQNNTIIQDLALFCLQQNVHNKTAH